MSNIIQCLLNKAQQNLISKNTIAQVSEIRDSLVSRQAAGSDLAKEINVANETLKILQDRLQQKTFQASIFVDLANTHKKRVTRLLEKGYTPTEVAATFSLPDEALSWKYGASEGSALEKISYYQSVYMATLADALKKIQPDSLFSLKKADKTTSANFIKELFNLSKNQAPDIAISKEIKEAAKAIYDFSLFGSEALRKAGADVRTLKTFLLGYKHDADKMVKMGADRWVELIKDTADLEPLYDRIPGARKDPNMLKDVLRQIYREQVSGGTVSLGDFAPKGLKSSVAKRTHTRWLAPKDADAYLRYHQKASVVDPYEHIVSYARTLGKDVGALEFYGPKPEAMVNSIIRQLSEVDPVNGGIIKDKMLTQAAFVLGTRLGPDRMIDPNIAKWAASIRSVNMLKLGKTAISALIQEPTFVKSMALRLRGLPVLKAAQLQIKYLASLDKTTLLKEAAKAGIYLEGFLDHYGVISAREGLEGGHKAADVLGKFTTQVTGLNTLTHSTKVSSSLVAAWEMANHSWSELDPAFVRWLNQKGITQQDFEAMNAFGKTKLDSWNAEALSPSVLFDAEQNELGEKLHKILSSISEFSSPTNNPNLSATFKKWSEAGKAAQIGASALRTFTGYPSSWFFNHIRTAMHIKGYGSKAAMLASQLVGLTITAIPVVMLYDLVAGKEPALDNNTVVRAIQRTGMIPILSDFILSQVGGGPMADKDFVDVIGGATLGTASDLVKGVAQATTGAGLAAIKGEDVGKQAVKGVNTFVGAAKSLVPFSSYWFSQLLMERLIWDNLRLAYDPNAHQAFKTKTQKANKDGTPYWWKPGQSLPQQ